MPEQDRPNPRDTRHEKALEHADLLRFWLVKLIANADVMGDEMDAPVRLPQIQAVEYTSLRTFIDRYDAARKALTLDAE